MKKFEGNINGKIYTDKDEFDKAILSMNRTDDMYVSYSYISVPDNDYLKEDSENNKESIGCENNYVSESEYNKIINDKNDVYPDIELLNKLKCATNKSEIEQNVCDKIVDFDNKIEYNLLQINGLETKRKKFEDKIRKFEDKIKLVDGEIEQLDVENNNYNNYKTYYTNIKNLMNEPIETTETNEECVCESNNDCKCEKDIKSTSVYNIWGMSPNSHDDLLKYLKKRNIYNFDDLVEYFLKKY